MSRLHSCSLAIFCLFFFPALVIAQDTGLTINGDSVSYDREKNLYQAIGSVEVAYKNVNIYGHHVVYDLATEEITARDGFVLTYNGMSIEGQELNYRLLDKTGQAKDIRFEYAGLYLAGRKIKLAVDELKLNEASFSTCDSGSPHYHVSAAEIILYPKYGWLVGYWGYFWLGLVPLVPMPTYIYDMQAEKRTRKNIPPFPEVGSNDEDGSYINERLAWYIRRELSGIYSLNYSAKKGFGAGLEADYILSDDSWGNARLYGSAADNLWGGITHQLFFGREINGAREKLNVFSLPGERQYELATTVSYRERINYERITLYPDLLLKCRKWEILISDLRCDADFLASLVKEEKNVKLARGGATIRFYANYPAILSVTPFATFDSRYYSDGEQWLKNSGGLELKKAFSPAVSAGLGYAHYFSVAGDSPFNFEKYRFRPADRLATNLLVKLGGFGGEINTSYYLDNWEPEDLDYALLFDMHCYNLMLKYRSLRREFQLGFSLTGGK